MHIALSALNVMVIHVQCRANVSNQTMLLDGVDFGPPKWPVCGCGLNDPLMKV